MGFFIKENAKVNNEEDIMLDEEFDMDAYMETCLLMELMSLSDEERKAISESEEAAILEAKGLIGRKTFVRLNKQDDLGRRTSAAAYQMAKDANDPLWGKLTKYMALKNEYKSKILKKYGVKAGRIAKASQKDYLKHPATKLLKQKDLADTREKMDKEDK